VGVSRLRGTFPFYTVGGVQHMFDFLNGADGKLDPKRALGFLLAVTAAVFIANKLPVLKKVV
jgi:hypothetical protein